MKSGRASECRNGGCCTSAAGCRRSASRRAGRSLDRNWHLIWVTSFGRHDPRVASFRVVEAETPHVVHTPADYLDLCLPRVGVVPRKSICAFRGVP